MFEYDYENPFWGWAWQYPIPPIYSIDFNKSIYVVCANYFILGFCNFVMAERAIFKGFYQYYIYLEVIETVSVIDLSIGFEIGMLVGSPN